MTIIEKRISAFPAIALDIFVKSDVIEKIELKAALPCAAFLCRIFSKNSAKIMHEAIFHYFDAYAEKKEELPKLPINLHPYSEFEKKVLWQLAEIPIGSTATYQEVATLIGHPNSARAVGNACHKNYFPIFLPCHRVIRKNGAIGGFASALGLKKKLLEFERLKL